MNLLIVYGTIEGQTRKIANFLADHASGLGHEVKLVDSADMAREIDVDSFDAVMLAGSVHQGRHQAALFAFAHDHRKSLNSRPTAFLSVSLSAASEDPEDRAEASTCASRFIDAAEWKPTVIHLVAGALRYTQYDFFKSWILKMIASTKGGPTDNSQDQEFTDWRDLRAFTGAFLAQAAGTCQGRLTSVAQTNAMARRPSSQGPCNLSHT